MLRTALLYQSRCRSPGGPTGVSPRPTLGHLTACFARPGCVPRHRAAFPRGTGPRRWRGVWCAGWLETLPEAQFEHPSARVEETGLVAERHETVLVADIDDVVE